MPRSLQELVESRQATEIIPGVLYFTSLSERVYDIGSEVVKPATQQQQAPSGLNTPRASEPEGNTYAFLRGDGFRTSVSHGFRGNAARNVIFHRRLCAVLGDDKGCCGILEDDAFYFSLGSASRFQYQPFFADFGPLGLDCVTVLSRYLKSLLELCASFQQSEDEMVDGNEEKQAALDLAHPNRNKSPVGGRMWRGSGEQVIPVVFCSGLGNHERANAACLLACFCVAGLGWSAAETWRVFQEAFPPIVSFRDASYGVSTFPLFLQDILGGLQRAVELGWYDPNTFDLQEYDGLRTYDCCWVIPKILLTFSSPVAGNPERAPVMYAKLFQELKVAAVVRLNEPLYDRNVFLSRGIHHEDLEFPDGTAPNDAVITRFMKVADPIIGALAPPPPTETRKRTTAEQTIPNSRKSRAKGVGRRTPLSRGELRGGNRGSAVAVHCHAGLGRTGTMACIYLIKRYNFTARGAVGWTRLARQGSVMGVQHMFLEKFERRLLRPVSSLDFLHAQHHLRVVGSGVVNHLSAYCYQAHTLRRTPSLNGSVSSLSLSLSGHSTQLPLGGCCEPGTSAVPTAVATVDLSDSRYPCNVVSVSRNSFCASRQGTSKNQLRNNGSRSPTVEKSRGGFVATFRAIATNTAHSRSVLELEREEVRRLPDSNYCESTEPTAADGALSRTSLSYRRSYSRTSTLTPPRVQALASQSRCHMSTRLAALCGGSELGCFRQPKRWGSSNAETACCLPSAVGHKGEDLLAVNATALGFCPALYRAGSRGDPHVPRRQNIPSAPSRAEAMDPVWGGGVVFLNP